MATRFAGPAGVPEGRAQPLSGQRRGSGSAWLRAIPSQVPALKSPAC